VGRARRKVNLTTIQLIARLLELDPSGQLVVVRREFETGVYDNAERDSVETANIVRGWPGGAGMISLDDLDEEVVVL